MFSKQFKSGGLPLQIATLGEFGSHLKVEQIEKE